MTAAPIQALSAIAWAPTDPVGAQAMARARAPASFGEIMLDGLQQTDAKVDKAYRLATAFGLDDSVSVHQVVAAQIQAIDALQLMLQVRARLTEGYQELMRMQL